MFKLSVHRHTKRIQVSFTKQQWEIIEALRGQLGYSDAELVRNIVIAWLSEKSMLPGNREVKQSGSDTKRANVR